MPPAAINDHNTDIAAFISNDLRSHAERIGRRDSILGFGSLGHHYSKNGQVYKARCTEGVFFVDALDCRDAFSIMKAAGHHPLEMFMVPDHVKPSFNGCKFIRA